MKLISLPEINEMFENRKKFVFQNYSELIETSERGIVLNFSVARQIEEVGYADYIKTGKKLEGFSAFKPVVYRKAVHFLNSAHLLFTNGRIDAAYSCLRTIIESIWRIYFLHLVPEADGILLFKSEAGQLQNNEHELVKNKFRFFSPDFMQRFLYADNNLTLSKKLYDALSKKSHSSVVGAMAEFEFRDAALEDLTKMLPMFSAALAITGLELMPQDQSTDSMIIGYFDSVGKQLGSVPALWPNKPELYSKLRFSEAYKTSIQV